MYGDTDGMRRRVTQLKEQGLDVRSMADQLVSQTESIVWTGRAADSMRERIRDRAAHLRAAAGQHETAADSLDRHLHEVELLKDSIDATERKAASIVADAQGRIAQVRAQAEADLEMGIRREADPIDEEVAAFSAPPSGHRDWLTVSLPGL